MSKVATQLEQRTADPNPEVVRDELLEMLARIGQPLARDGQTTTSETRSHGGGSASPETANAPTAVDQLLPEAAASQQENVEAAQAGCPHCGSLESWGSASWCPTCGHYPAIGRKGEVSVSADETPVEFSIRDLLPGWFLFLVSGVVAIVAVTIGLNRFFAATPGFVSLASLVQLSIGLLLLLMAHIGAYLAGLKGNQLVSLKEFLFYPPAVWLPTFKRLPESSSAVVNLSWGVTAIVAALSILGPIKIDEIQRDLKARSKPKNSAMKTMLGAASSMADTTNGPGSAEAGLEGSLGAFAGQAMDASDVGSQKSGSLENSLGAFAGQAMDASDVGAKPGLVGGALSTGAGAKNSDVENVDPSTPEASAAATETSPESAGVLSEGDKDKPVAEEAKGQSSTTAKRPPVPVTSILPKDQQPAKPVTNGMQPIPVMQQPTQSIASSQDDAKFSKCVIFGYLANAAGEPRTLLLATSDPTTRPRYVGRIPLSQLPLGMQDSLVETLPTIRTRRAIASCPYGGQWVEPAFQVTIRHTGWVNNEFKDAGVESLERQ